MIFPEFETVTAGVEQSVRQATSQFLGAARWRSASAHAMDARTGIVITEEANDGAYRVLLEGLESALARTLPASGQEEDQWRYAIAGDGRYLTSAPFLAEPATAAATKATWSRGMDEGVGRTTMPHRPLRR